MNDDAGSSRRTFLGAAGATIGAAGALLAAGCGAGHPGVRPTAPAPVTAATTADVNILGRLLELERRTIDAYAACIPLLDRRSAKAAKQFLGEELEHAGELLALIKAAGGAYPERAASYDIGHPSDGAEAAAVLHSLESAQVAGYLRAIPRLSLAPMRAAVATILSVDAQHVSMLRLVQGQDPVPSAFVSGAQ